MNDNIEYIAKLCHEINKVFCEYLGDSSHPNWNNAPDWQKQTVVNGVKYHIDNPNAGANASHTNWMLEKEKEGWKYGEVKNVETKEHPCMVPFEDLPKEQQFKDVLFSTIVKNIK